MRNKAAVVTLFMFSVCSILPTVYSQQTNWATLVTIRDLTDNTVLRKDQPLLAGHSINVTVSINIPFTQAFSRFDVTLDRSMQIMGSQYWYVITANYGGYDPMGFTPGSKTITFKQVQGQLDLYVLLAIPQEVTISDQAGLKLHFAKQNYEIITVSVTGGSKVGNLTVIISDSSIEAYLNVYAQKSSLMPSGKIDKAYSAFVSSVLQQAQEFFNLGFPDKATNLVNIISVDAFPAPPNTMLTTLLVAAAIGLAVLCIVSVVMLLRSRTSSEYGRSVIGGVQKELAGIEVTAAQYDKALSDRLRALREKLGEAT